MTTAIQRLKLAFTTPRSTLTTAVLAGSVLISESAMAFTRPAAGAPGYDMYELIVTNGLQGVPGFIGGAWLIAQAGQIMKDSVWKAGLQAVGGVGLIKADAILPTMGALIGF